MWPVMLDADDPRSNLFLAALPGAEWRRWRPQMQAVEMPLGQVLYESGTALHHVDFPVSAVVSLPYVMENGDSAEIAMIGNVGLAGTSLFVGGDATPSRAVVQSAGHGWRLPASAVKAEFDRARPEQRTSECCAAVRKEYDRLLPGRTAA